MRKWSGSLWVMACLMVFTSQAQDYELKSTVEIYQELQELHRGVRVLYLAAHPDDENTRLISWLENDQHVQTAYLSLTRGQGGQNLIGDEKGDGLGVIRSYELLEARKVDGAEQFFTRAIDFGYSKSAEESFEFWGKQAVLEDVVRVIRSFRPHVIVTRFPPTRRAGHGHHEASAILAEEAFDLAADPTAFATQLEGLAPWKTTALYHNTSSWWDKSLDEKSDSALLDTNIIRVDIGVYNDLLGYGMNEIASMARSKHRCQAFGTPRRRGVQHEYLLFVKGEWDPHFIDHLQGIWKRSPAHQQALGEVLDAFDFTNREANLVRLRELLRPKLAQRSMWADAPDMTFVKQKVEEIELDLLGLRVEVFAGKDPVLMGTEYPVEVEVYHSGTSDLEVAFDASGLDTTVRLQPGERLAWTQSLIAPEIPSDPFWLRDAHDGWLYRVPGSEQIGLAVEPDRQIRFVVNAEGTRLRGVTTLHRRWNDRSVGEIIEPMAFVPPLTVTPAFHSKVIREGEAVALQLSLKAYKDIQQLTLDTTVPEGMEVVSVEIPTSMKRGQERRGTLTLRSKGMVSEAVLQLNVLADGVACTQMQSVIDYPHIPMVYLHDPSEVTFKPLELSYNPGKRILYVDGSGDEVDDVLTSLGYDVSHASLNELSEATLNAFDAVITGIRAFNRNEELAANTDMLYRYVEQGGKLIVQYNTTYDLLVDTIGPYPLELSRERVTDEHATVNILDPAHPVFNRPNALQPADWEGWVQERGLYFAGQWGDEYTPLIAWSDAGEKPVKGGLLVAGHGKGHVVYTGISFFRQLPAGVPGAYRLMINLIEF